MSELPHQVVTDPSRGTRIRIVFVCAARSSLTAGLAFGVALLLQLHQPLWAPVSALITSKENLGDTFSEFCNRVIGTALGATLAIACQMLMQHLHLATPIELMVVTAVTAAVIANRPQWRVGLWTAVIILLSKDVGSAIWETALMRFLEVTLGSTTAIVIAALETRVRRLWPDSTRH
ncbi:FUSC family protein [Pseudomonas sp. W2I6]|jgi:uncharacterized membrane protein YccC|uniref:FUSC family protein n=1 Tax=Pseudomonas sp. W2I6 TaxID=3042289 RepID=UPI002785D975|nr:FUSC family protein [Pseudomonas sp. W2I6]MDQ0668188.1 putative membrane protein YccC [Pseudomonas sp. W2I6]